MPVFNNALAGAAGSGGADADFKIERSLRFNSADSAYLSRDMSNASSTYTFSTWIKRAAVSGSTYQYIFGSGAAGLAIHTDDTLYVFDGSSVQQTTAVFRDPSSWYHLVFSVNSGSFTLYVNGVSVKTGTAASLSTTANATSIGRYSGGTAAYYLDAYLADTQLVDGQALAETDFGEFSEDTGVWNPIEFTGSHNPFTGGSIYSANSSTLNDPTNAWDGSTSTGAYVSTNGALGQFTNLSISVTTSMRVRIDSGSGGNIYINGSSNTAFSGGAAQWVSVTNPPSTVTSVGIQSTSGPGILAVEVDGSILEDTINSVNGFHLDFSDNSSNAALGYDAAGSNDWSVNNLVATGSQDGISTTKPTDVTGDWTGVVGVAAANTSGPYAVFPDGGGQDNTSGRFSWSGLSVGDTITVYLTTSGTDNRQVYGDVDESSTGSSPGSTLGTITLTASAASGSAKIDFNGTANIYGITPGPIASRYVDDGIDSPTNYEAETNIGGNYATLNPITPIGSNCTFSNGNLDVSVGDTSTNGNRGIRAVSNMGMTSGKWYCEHVITGGSTARSNIGVVSNLDYGVDDGSGNYWIGSGANDYIVWSNNGTAYIGNSQSNSYGVGWGVGDVIGCAFDADEGKMYIYKNGTVMNNGTPSHTGLTDGPYFFIFTEVGSDISVNFGQRPFQYAPGATGGPPSDYKALCTQNLDDPLIADGSTAFEALAYTGDGGTSRSISSLNFSPDLVWFKNRGTLNYHQLHDILRGADKRLYSNDTAAENTYTTALTSFDDNGWTMSNGTPCNANNNSYIAWAWDAGDLATNSAYNQSAVWSTQGTITNTGTAPDYYANTFDGTISAVGDAPGWDDGWRIGGTQTATGTSTVTGLNIAFTSSVKIRFMKVIYGGNNSDTQFKINNVSLLDGTAGNGNFEDIDVTSSITSPITSWEINRNAGNNNLIIAGIFVDGKRLVDPGIIPAGGLNSSVYDTSQTWSTNSTMSSAAGAFDGSAEGSSGNATYSSTGNVLTSSSITINSKLEIYTNRTHTGAQNGTKITINGTDYYDKPLAATGYSEIDLSGVTLPLTTSGNILIEDEGGSASGLWSVRVDGKRLVDSTATPPNVPSIASTVRANPSAGFSIVTFSTGLSGVQSIGHGLNAAPEFVITKQRNASSNWIVYHKDGTSYDQILRLNLTDAVVSLSTAWGSSSNWNSSTFGINTSSNQTGDVVAYCFAPVEGYSAIGSYVSNNNVDGPFVYLGFQPKLIIWKNRDANHGWYMYDDARNPNNPMSKYLAVHSSNAEGDPGGVMDVLSNGFKVRNTGFDMNTGSNRILYMAWAESPFKYNRAR